MSDYSDEIVDYYLRPRKRGKMEKPSAEKTRSNPVCGDTVTIQLKISGGKIKEALFSGTGCAISTASASMLMEAIEGKPISAVKRMGPDEIRKLLGIEITRAREHCAMLALETAKGAIFEALSGKRVKRRKPVKIEKDRLSSSPGAREK